MNNAQFWSDLGVRLPIIQAPMVGVSNPTLAAEVSNAGGLGSIGLGASTPEQAHALIRQTRALTDRPYNLNLFCHKPARFNHGQNEAWRAYVAQWFPEFDAVAPQALREIYKSFLDDRAMLEMLLDERPPVVSFHFGAPDPAWVAQLRAAGTVTLGCATTLKEAQLLQAVGIDAIVAQGYEAGGHRGVFDDSPHQDQHLGLFPLTRLLAAQTTLPVIAAGGIMDGAGINAALALGACGVQMGTAFILCPESSATPEHRAAFATAEVYETRVTRYLSGRPARGFANRLYLESAGANVPPPAEYPLAYDLAKALHAAAVLKGNHDFAAQWAGQGAPLARALPAAQLIHTLADEMRTACATPSFV